MSLLAPDLRLKTVALAGNPNSGKTTLFNALTGLKQKVANYPGVTVEKKTGRCTLADGSMVDVIDLPGAYSIISRSPDERVTMQVLRGLRKDTAAPDVVIAVVDASNLSRNLYLVSQLIELGRPMVVALNMMDIAQRRGIRVSAQLLQEQLGVPVIPVTAARGEGVAELKAALAHAVPAPRPLFDLPVPMREQITELARSLHHEPAVVHQDPHVLAERLLIHDESDDLQSLRKSPRLKSLISAAHEHLTRLGIDPMQADIEAHYGWIDHVAARSLEPACGPLALGVESLMADASADASGDSPSRTPIAQPHAASRTLTDRLDRILLHKVWGLAVFALVMAVLFVSIFYLAAPIMDATQAGVTWLGNGVTWHIPDGPLHDLWSDGIVAGVGSVLVFVPQIAILFLFLAILEDSGYLARAAFLMDRLLGKVGLNGKSFIPLLSSFACAIPGIMATRTIEDRRDRLATIFVAPFMSCSARLPVYTLLIGAFFASFSPLVQGGIMFGCYALGILAAVGTAWVFKRTFLKGGHSAFILELPTYKLPQASQVGRVVVTNTWAFVRRAGTLIFALSVILWALTYYPRLPGGDDGSLKERWEIDHIAAVHIEGSRLMENTLPKYGVTTAQMDSREDVAAARRNATRARAILDDQELTESQKLEALWNFTNPAVKPFVESKADEAIAADQLRYSFAGRFGHFIEPAIRPLGYDWKMGVGLVGAFAAREVFVSTMGIVYSAGDTEQTVTPLEDAMKADRTPAGTPVWTPAVAISLLAWFVLAMQCMSTLAIVRRETGTWTWPLVQLLYMTGLAYVVALVLFQLLSRWGA